MLLINTCLSYVHSLLVDNIRAYRLFWKILIFFLHVCVCQCVCACLCMFECLYVLVQLIITPTDNQTCLKYGV